MRMPVAAHSSARGAGAIAILALLALAGIGVARSIRGGEERAPPQRRRRRRLRRTGPKLRPPAPSQPPRHTWGPLTAEPSGRLATPLEGSSVVAAGKRLVVLGGRNGGDPRAAVLLGAPQGIVPRVATLPKPLASSAPLALPDAVYLIGGERGETVSDEIVRVDLATKTTTLAGRFFEPLAGAGHAQVDDSLLIVGGWTGEKLATAVLRYSLDGRAALVARLPEALRDPAVAVLGGSIYVAGGRTASGPSRIVYSVELASGTVTRVGELPHAVSSAVLVVRRRAALSARWTRRDGTGGSRGSPRSTDRFHQRRGPNAAPARRRRRGASWGQDVRRRRSARTRSRRSDRRDPSAERVGRTSVSAVPGASRRTRRDSSRPRGNVHCMRAS